MDGPRPLAANLGRQMSSWLSNYSRLSRYHIPSGCAEYYRQMHEHRGLYKDIADKCGIDKSWITWGNRLVRLHNGCQFVGDKAKEYVKKNSGFWYNYPLPVTTTAISNPKNIIGPNYTQLLSLTARMEKESGGLICP